ncbi:MAG: hypothetical protein WD114_03640 [Phycisphaerales bacterium]
MSYPPPAIPAPFPKRTRLKATLIVVGITLLACWAMILSGNMSGRGAADDLNFHWLAINQFADQLPRPDLSDYASATTPGYHLLLAPLAAAGFNHTAIQLVASVWTLCLLGVLAWVISRRAGMAAVVLTLPVIASMYVLFPGIWLLPDNAGWLLVLLIVLLSLRPNPGWGTWMLGGALLLVLVWMRQVHIWAAAPLWLAAWLGGNDTTPSPARFFGSFYTRAGRTCIAIACTVPAFIALAWFVLTWEGLVPPTFQNMHQGPNIATTGFILTQLAILSVFFTPLLWPRLRELWSHHWRWILAAAALGLILGVIPHSSYFYDEGRYGGWWNVIGKLPTAADRSPVFVLGSLAGSLALVVWLSLADRRSVWIWVGVLVAFTLAQTANHASWQRYHEPLLLFMILLILGRSAVIERCKARIVLGAACLTLMLAAITIASIISTESLLVDPEQAGEPENSAFHAPDPHSNPLGPRDGERRSFRHETAQSPIPTRMGA